MQTVMTKPHNMQTFSGLDVDQRFARDDVDEPILRERDLQMPVRADDDDKPEEDDDEQKEEYRKGM